MRQETKYWICQFLGWGSFAALSIINSSTRNELGEPSTLVADVLFAVLALALTHLARTHLYQKAWQRLSTEKLVPLVLIAIFALSLVLGTIYTFALDILYHENFIQEAKARFSGVFFVSVLMIGTWHLIYFIIKFIKRNRNLLIDQLQMENNVKSLQIKSIKNNLQPHFIFNALNSIRALIDENPARARDSITQLSNILRSSIMADKLETVPLKKELEIVEDYLSLEGIRYEQRLQVFYDIHKDTLDLPVPPLMLQTLCENAIKHGISAFSQGGVIKLSSQIENNIHVIRIQNTGQFNPERVLPPSESNGFGLESTKQRLAFLFGELAVLDIRNLNDTDVLLTIKIPISNQTLAGSTINSKSLEYDKSIND